MHLSTKIVLGTTAAYVVARKLGEWDAAAWFGLAFIWLLWAWEAGNRAQKDHHRRVREHRDRRIGPAKDSTRY